MYCRSYGYYYIQSKSLFYLKVFNLALLDKWCWRLKREKCEFWCKVLIHKYETLDGEVVWGSSIYIFELVE